jgi:RNA polymerase sigma factor (sigma-70 family)
MVDPGLVQRFCRGDPDALRAMYGHYAGAVFTIARRALDDRSLAEEVVQLTFFKAWRAAASFDPARDVGPWLYAIARRTTIDVYRRERRHRSVALDAEIVSLPTVFEDLWELWAVRSAIDQLPENERLIVEGVHYRGKTLREIAEEHGVPLGTVKSRSHRAHARLARLLAHVREVTA